MDSLEINKIVGAILTAGVIAMLTGFVANIVSHRAPLEEMAYTVAPSEPSASTAAEAEPMLEPIAPLLAAASVDSGQGVAKKCATCHTFEEGGANKIGPNLYDVVNRPIGSHEGFSYSGAMQEKSSESWTYEHLNAFLAQPKDFVPGTKMSFAGLRKVEDRADLIAYLRTLSGSPAALP